MVVFSPPPSSRPNRVCHVTTVANGYHQPPLSPPPPTTITGHLRQRHPIPTMRRRRHVTTPAAQCTPGDGACGQRCGKVPRRPDSDDACHRHNPQCEVSFPIPSPPSFSHTKCRGHVAVGDMATIPPAHDHIHNDNQHNHHKHEHNNQHEYRPPMRPRAQTTAHKRKRPSTYEGDRYEYDGHQQKRGDDM